MTTTKPSKSARKREQHERQALGEQLIALNDADLATIPLDERLGAAIRDARSIKAREALRRQKQFVGKLMRDIDIQPILDALEALRLDELRDKRVFAHAEKWRDRLVREGRDALDAFASETGQADATLGELLTQLDVAVSDRDEKSLRRQIFRRVHEILVTIA